MGGTAPRGHSPWCLLSQGYATFSCGNGKRKLLTVPRGAVCKWPFVCLGFSWSPSRMLLPPSLLLTRAPPVSSDCCCFLFWFL